ncbi:MAG: hypothetical protein JXR77_06020 [Lentisphaeria bacterium]|nr:hypothetical protein [Lentisphaeria bacterium]
MGNFAVFEDGPSNPLTGASDAGVKQGELPRPSETYLMADGEIELAPSLFDTPVVGDHNIGFNALFADEHAARQGGLYTGNSYVDLGGNAKVRLRISGGRYNGREEVWGVVSSSGSIVSLR